ncbi:MAG: HEAT repeat domain-containing protein [Acidobacteriota bacterium]|nr:HEAT repeat domain-containing protein [Acidobacteriota bacterium]
MDQALNRIFAEFASNPVSSGKAMRGLLESDREQFVLSSLPILRAVQQNQAFNYLLTLLLMNDLILEQLTNPNVFSLDEAIDLARAMLRIEPLLDIKMVRRLLDTKDLSSREELEKRADTERGLRLLEIMAAISDGARILPVMAQLLRHPNSKVRSKAALLVGRSNKNYQWVEQRQLEPDPRVRANALESLWGVDSEGARQVLWAASEDPDNRAAGNAIYGLYQLGEAGSIPLMLEMLDHAQEDFRTTAVWIIGETGDPRFLPVLANLMNDSESKIRAAVFRGIAKLKKNAVKFAGQPNLDLYVGPTELLGSGTRHLRVSVCAHTASAGGPGDYTGSTMHALAALKPTQFVIHEGATLISEYEVLEEAHPESLSLAFALPRVVETNDALHRALELAFSTALRHKRKNDAWLTLRYSCDSPTKQRVASRSSTTSILNINSSDEALQTQPASLSLPPDMRFSTEPEAILSAVANPGSRLSAAPGVMSAAQMLVASLASTRGSRHVVLLCQQTGSISLEESLEIARSARANKIAIHVIAGDVCPALKNLCSRTGGFWLEKIAEELPGALETLCANLTGHYHIRYKLDSPDVDSNFAGGKIEIFGEQGSGKNTFGFAGQPAIQGAVRPDPEESRSLNSRTELALK